MASKILIPTTKFLPTLFITVITLVSLLVVECRASCSCCPFEWAEYNGQCYRPFLQSLGYGEAREHCQSKTRGKPGHLLKIDSQDEMVFIMEYIDTILGDERDDFVWPTEDISTQNETNNLIFSSALGESDGHNHHMPSCTFSIPAVDVNVDTGTFKMIDSPDFVDSNCAVYIDGGAYVELGDFAGTCVSDPDMCATGKVSWSIWLKLNSIDLGTLKKYYVSVGGQTRNAHGVAFLNKENTFRFSARSFEIVKYNTAVVLEPHLHVPVDVWFHLAATVDLTQTNTTDIVNVYINGTRISSATIDVETDVGANDSFTRLFLGRPNNVPTGQEISDFYFY